MFSLFSLYFSFFGTICTPIFARYTGFTGSVVVSTISLFFSFVFAFLAFLDIFFYGTVSYFVLFNWFEFGGFTCSFSFLFDALSVIMMLVVTSISTAVHLYASSYMESDPHLPRFMFYLSMFTFFMLLLVSSANLLQLFIGWEGIGLSSYLLIGFWFTRFQATQSAFKALLVNRVGDVGLVLALSILYFYFGTLDFSTLYFLSSSLDDFYLDFLDNFISLPTFVCFFIILAAMAKSAQLGLHTWLPDAMEGPTPVSALIHAATLVTAGVFLVVRFSFLFEYSEVALNFLALLGVFTALLGATIGLYQYDIKRVIAYSTCSQLGYMFYACGLSSYDLAMFHLANHAYFKALLFLGAGSVIHALQDEQDMRKMGGLVKFLPFTHWSMLLGTLALIGFPFLSGFYSKDFIVENSFYGTFSFVYWVGIFAAFCSSFYSFRMLYYVFYSTPRFSYVTYQHAHEASYPMAIPLFFLSIASIFAGYLFSNTIVDLSTDFWQSSIFVHPIHAIRQDAEFSFFYAKLSATLIALFGVFTSLIVHVFFPDYLLNSRFRTIFLFLNKKWFFDPVYNFYLTKSLSRFSYESVLNYFDRGVIEFFLVRLSKNVTSIFFNGFSRYQSGYVYHYFFSFILGVVFIGAILFFSTSPLFHLLFKFFFAIFIILTLSLYSSNQKEQPTHFDYV